jgi:CRISPR-associated DxTHG motif protein
MKLLTFLGVAKYQQTCYVFQDQEHLTFYSPAASCRFLKPDSVTVFLTEEAEQYVMDDFVQSMPADVSISRVPIPMGRTEEELWQIFDQVSRSVHPKEEVAFDITHGLRSFPLVGMLCAAFLQSGLRVKVKALLYGAFDVRDTTVEPSRTPMFDLSPMLGLLDWAKAADRFNQSGDAAFLADLLGQRRGELARLLRNDRSALQDVGGLGNLAGGLRNISLSLQLIRPYGVLGQAARLAETIDKARPALEMSPPALPFARLLDRIYNTYAPLGLAAPDEPENAAASLQSQRTLIEWYVKREQWVQAITLCREWLISWFMYQVGEGDFLDYELREGMKDRINGALRSRERSKDPILSIPGATDALRAWSRTTEARNDIDHAGMRKDSGDAGNLVKTIRNIMADIQSIPIGECS